MMDIVTKAKEFASHAHKNHVRKDKDKTPYIYHVEETAENVRKSGGNEREIAAAWLHDTVEDTPTTIEDILREFGDEICDIVEGVTDLPEWNNLSMHERKTEQAERILNASNSIKRVKLSDQASNVRIAGLLNDIFTLDEKFVYLDRAKQIAEACRGVSPYLDELFAKYYKVTFKNLKASQEQGELS